MRTLALGLLLLLPGCVIEVGDGGYHEPDRYEGPAPGAEEVRQASAWLNDAIAQSFRDGLPSQYARSRDFPELPLVRLLPIEDRGHWDLDPAPLRATLEKSIRDHRSLRLEADEVAVFRHLGDGKEKQPPPPAQLELEGWAGQDGRFHLRLLEEGGGVLVEVESDPAGTF